MTAEIVELLVRAGANVKAANRYGVTPLWLACVNGNAVIDRDAVAGRGRREHGAAGRRNRADDGGAHREGRCREGAARSRSRGEREGGLARADRADVGGGRGACRRDRGADRARRGHPGAFERRIHGAAVRRPRGADRRGSDPVESGRESERFAAGQRPRQPGSHAPALPAPAPNGPRRPRSASMRSCSPPRTRITSSPRGCWTAAPIPTPPRRDGRRCIRCRGFARPASPAATTRRPRAPAAWTVSSLCRKLVAKGAALNARVTKRPGMGVTTLNSIGATPFLLAARTADAELMRLLAELGADPLLRNEDNTTPLMVAAGLGTQCAGRRPGDRAGSAGGRQRWRWSSATI